MYYEPPMKFTHAFNPILSTPNVDVEEYNKLREKPYPQQSCKNLPLYFLEPESMGPRICASDLDKLPLDKFSNSHVDKLKRLYICLTEECGFKKYLTDEQRIMGHHEMANKVYYREISGSNFRIRHIKDDIFQFLNYLTKMYNLKKETFDSVVEAGLACAVFSCSMHHCFGVAAEAMQTGANISYFIWMCVFEFLVVRMQTYIQLTLSKYSNGTSYNAWSFCPYVQGLGITLVIVEFLGSLLMFWESPLCLIKAWSTTHFFKVSGCEGSIKMMKALSDTFSRDRSVSNVTYRSEMFDIGLIKTGRQCYAEANNYTMNMVCAKVSCLRNDVKIFNSNYFNYYVKELSYMSFSNFSFNNGLLYVVTLLFWFFMTRTVRYEFNLLIQTMHCGAMLMMIFLFCCFGLAVCTVDAKIAKEGTYAFFSINKFFNIKGIVSSFKHSLMLIMPFYLDLGPKMPYEWSPDAVFSWKATAHLGVHFFGMWFSYLAVYNEKYFYKSKDISCFNQSIYLLNSALPRFFNSLGIPNTVGFIFFLLQAYLQFLIFVTLATMVWRNLNYNIAFMKKYPIILYVFDFMCLGVMTILMFNIGGYQDYWQLLEMLKYILSTTLSILVICFDLTVVAYYGMSRVWVDLQFLTRRRIDFDIEISYIVSFFIHMWTSLLGMPIIIEELKCVPTFIKIILLSIVIAPFLIMMITALISGPPSSEVRNFHYWGERSQREQYERLRFNPAQFKTSDLRLKEIDMNESGYDFYLDQRKKALVRIAVELGQRS